MRQFSSIHLQISCLVSNKSGREVDVTPYVTSTRLLKSLSTWYVEAHLTFQLPRKAFMNILPLQDATFKISLQLQVNGRTVDSVHYESIVLLNNISNTLDGDDPIQATFVLVPKTYEDLIKGVEFYVETQTTNKEVINTLISNISKYEMHQPDMTVNVFEPFIPYQPLIKALAYACRQFAYSNDVYHGYVDFNAFKLVKWNEFKNNTKDLEITLFPKQHQVTSGFIRNISHMERVDLLRRIPSQTVDYVLERQQAIDNEPFLYIDNQSINSPYEATLFPDNALSRALSEHTFIDIDMIHIKRIFASDLLRRLDVQTNYAEFFPLVGTYMVTDIEVVCDFTSQTHVPYNRLRAVKRG